MSRLAIYLLALSHAANVAGYCYTRNGTTITSKAYQPCSNTTSDSACCGTNHVGAGDTGVANDVCKDNGLCQNFEGFDGNNEGQQLWWRQGCTDPTWESAFCLGDVCKGAQYAIDNAPVRNCGGNKWCCGDPSCCNAPKRIFQLAATVGQTSTASSIATSIPPSSTPSTTTSPNTNTASSSGLSAGAKAGIGVGAAVVVVLALIVAVLLLRLKKAKGRRHETVSDQTPYVDGAMGVQEHKYQTDDYAQELPGQTGRIEIGGREERVELVGHDVRHELDGDGGMVR